MKRIMLMLIVPLGCSAPTFGVVNVVTTTQSFADVVRRIGGPEVHVVSIMRGPENPHHVVPKPSYMMKLRRAKLLVHSGLDMEPWVPLLIKGSRKSSLAYGQLGNLDASKGIQLKEIPKPGQLSRAQGDIHVFGNPHYAMDPLNIITVARNVMTRLQQIDPGHAEGYAKRFDAYAAQVREGTARLVAKMKPYWGTKVVIYHRAWPYFCDRFGLVKVAEIEPKPGITPGPQHLRASIDKMKAAGAKLVIVDTYSSKKNAEFVAAKGGGKAVVLAQDVHALPGCDSYLGTIEYDIDQIMTAMRDVGISPHASPGAAAGTGADRHAPQSAQPAAR